MNDRQPIVPLSGLVMAGGRSARFGSDKAALDYRGATLLDHIVALLASCVDPVYVSINTDQASDTVRTRHAVLVDADTNLGPMAGLVTAHRHAPESAWLVVACDMPGLDEACLRKLIEQRATDRDATAYRSPRDGMAEPMCAIYEPILLARLENAVKSGVRPAPRDELGKSDVRLISARNPDALVNINRPEDLAKLERAGAIKP